MELFNDFDATDAEVANVTVSIRIAGGLEGPAKTITVEPVEQPAEAPAEPAAPSEPVPAEEPVPA